MKTIVKAIDENWLEDGRGKKYHAHRLVTPGKTYLVVVADNKCTIIKQLLTQEKVIDTRRQDYIERMSLKDYKIFL
jgi:phage gp36-like protein